MNIMPKYEIGSFVRLGNERGQVLEFVAGSHYRVKWDDGEISQIHFSHLIDDETYRCRAHLND